MPRGCLHLAKDLPACNLKGTAPPHTPGVFLLNSNKIVIELLFEHYFISKPEGDLFPESLGLSVPSMERHEFQGSGKPALSRP